MPRAGALWALTLLLTLGSAAYQRLTGPTHPVRGTVEVRGQEVRYRLPRSHVTAEDALVRLAVPDTAVSGEITWRRLRSRDLPRTEPLERAGGALMARIPRQPPAGRVGYAITLIEPEGRRVPLRPEPTVMRFKGRVPLLVLIPHVLAMFIGMGLSTRAGLEALARGGRLRRYAWLSTVLLAAGGLLLGPIVQRCAFGAFWTGWPAGHDLTDNKTAAAVILWLIALARTRRAGGGRGWSLVASLGTLAVYLIPHSVLGSELDYTQANAPVE